MSYYDIPKFETGGEIARGRDLRSVRAIAHVFACSDRFYVTSHNMTTLEQVFRREITRGQAVNLWAGESKKKVDRLPTKLVRLPRGPFVFVLVCGREHNYARVELWGMS